jgi:type IV pilus assembly protein PilA
MKQIQKGFTLIELMIVVAIIGILAAVAIPAYQDYVTKAKLARVSSSLDALKLTLGVYLQENGSYPNQANQQVTTATAGGTLGSTDVWSSLGLPSKPGLPAELSMLTYDGSGTAPTLLLTYANGVGSGIDTLTMTLTATVSGTGTNWKCSAKTTTSTIANKFFGC